jgi:hypothetical protein
MEGQENKKLSKKEKKALKKHGKPDLIYAHFTFISGYAARYFSKKYDIPYAVQEHYSLFLRKDLPEYLKKITRETVSDASAFFAVSEKLKENIEEFTGIKGKIGVVNNLVNSRYVYFEPKKKDKFIFFAAGNLVKSKKFDLLIVDEAHRLRRRKNLTQYAAFDQNNSKFNLGEEGTELDWIRLQSKYQIFLYDEDQSIKHTDIDKEKIKEYINSEINFEFIK